MRGVARNRVRAFGMGIFAMRGGSVAFGEGILLRGMRTQSKRDGARRIRADVSEIWMVKDPDRVYVRVVVI